MDYHVTTRSAGRMLSSKGKTGRHAKAGRQHEFQLAAKIGLSWVWVDRSQGRQSWRIRWSLLR